MEAIRNLLVFILILGSLIFMHEAGHFIAAMLFRVKIKEFGIGIPPRLWRIGSWRDTEITLNWLPLGGFVRPEGEFDPTHPEGLAASSPWIRLGFFFAGPFANLLIGFLLLVAGFTIGWPDQVGVTGVSAGSPAEAAGLLPNDVVLQVDDTFIHDTIELSEYIYSHTGQQVVLDVQRGGEHLSIPLIPRTEWPENEGAAGFFTTSVIVRYPLPSALRRAIDQMLVMVQETVHQIIRLARGQASSDEVRITGPIGLKTVSDMAVENALDYREWFPVLYLIAWVSTALGLTNLLPLPALDGGRALFIGIEIVRGKPVSMKIEKIIHAAGLIALLILLAVLTVNDILNPYS
ncbi:MAG: site-2 protease family protein, partial [Anaerolineales bacterium]|nr:site-2 protease family protein [Anaerolineales bacterium]